MGERYRNKYAQKTIYDELIENDYTYESKLKDYLNEVYDSRIKFLKRQAGKGMADILEDLDTHVVDRATHMNQTANIAAIMADNLGLNSMLARYGMRAHDCGHPFGSHEGEEVLNQIGILSHCGFFHHNAKGIDVALSEDLIGKFIDAALNSISDENKRNAIKNDPEKMKRLENDTWYFLEFIVGHDGEATRTDIKNLNSDKKFNSIKESVLYYTSKSNRENKYKAQVSTLEAVLAKPADVIAYLKTDVENSFRKGIVKGFSDNYLERVGELLFEKNGEKLSREERIKKSKEYIKEIEKSKLRETYKDVFSKEGKEVLEAASSIVEKVNQIRNSYI